MVSQRLALVSLALLSRFMNHRSTKTWIWQGSACFTSDPRDMLLSLHIGFSFVRAAVACAILERTSGFQPSSETIASRYLKLVIVPSFCPLNSISLWMPLVLSVISFVFLALTSILYLVQVLFLSRLSTGASSSCSSSSRASMYWQTADWYGSSTYGNLFIMFFQSIRHF